MTKHPLKTFIIYARKDESFKNDLLLHLRGSLLPTHLEVWQDGEILPGEAWEKKIEEQLERAEVFIVLLSIHSLTSDFIQKKELVRALEKNGRIVPILVRSCYWENNPVFANLQGLPKNMKPVSSFFDQDDAWTEVMVALHDMVEGVWAEEKTDAPMPNSLSTPKISPVETPKWTTGLPDMVFVKGGTFMMGRGEGQKDNEKQYQVTLSDFEIGKHPVTQKLWKEVMGNNPSNWYGKSFEYLPVESVSWEDVQDFLKRLNARFPSQNYRLPTEAEWEYAARGGRLSRGFIFAGSDDLMEVGWFNGNANFKTNIPMLDQFIDQHVEGFDPRPHSVGKKKPNELGLYDMSGNVYEWCADWYGEYPTEPQINPAGPKLGTNRVNRGGSWISAQQDCRIVCRNEGRPIGRGSAIGFRLALSLQ